MYSYEEDYSLESFYEEEDAHVTFPDDDDDSGSGSSSGTGGWDDYQHEYFEAVASSWQNQR